MWLGVEGDDSAEAIDFIKQCVDFDNFDQLVRDSFASRKWAALSALIRRPWFQRRWIIQEIALAQEAVIYCGSHFVSWRDFADVMSLFATKIYEIRQLFRESTAFRNHPDYLGDLTELSAIRLVYAADNMFRKSENGTIMEKLFSLETLMSSLSAFDASDPHDIVYAVLSLAKDATPVSKDAYRMESRNQYDSLLQTTVSVPYQVTPRYAFPQSILR